MAQIPQSYSVRKEKDKNKKQKPRLAPGFQQWIAAFNLGNEGSLSHGPLVTGAGCPGTVAHVGLATRLPLPVDGRNGA